jgi:hypothetical protein
MIFGYKDKIFFDCKNKNSGFLGKKSILIKEAAKA